MLLTATAARVDELVARAQADGQAPSIILGVVRDGTLAHVACAGDDPAPTPDTQYRIGSITKTHTATLVLRLRDEGRLTLDDPVETHLPGTPVGAVTVRQLLGHVSGLRREPDGPWWERAAGVDLPKLLAGLRPEMLVHPPLRTHHYSNLAYAVLAAIAERITGESWWNLVDGWLLSPLGMRRTTYQCQQPYARGYVVHPWHGTLREEPRHDAGAMAPAGQLWSTLDDLAAWAGFVAAPKPEVLAAATLDEMCAPVVISDPEAWTAGHGLGFQLWRRGERVMVGHSGSMPGYLAMLLVHRRSGTATVGFVNSYNAEIPLLDLFGGVIDEVIDREPEQPRPWQPATTASPEPVAQLCGRWWFMGREAEVSYDGDAAELVLRFPARPAAPAWRFVAEGTDRWRGVAGMNHGESLLVRRSADGRPATLDIATFEFTRDPLPDRV